MRKGFVFTADALFALVTIIILWGLLSFDYQLTDGKTKAIENQKTLARDNAVVNFYLGEDSCVGRGYDCSTISCCIGLQCVGGICQEDPSYQKDFFCVPFYIYPFCENCSLDRLVCEETA